MPFHTDLLRFELGLAQADVLPNVAVEALESGIDSPGLRLLASYSLIPDDPQGVADAYRQVRRELPDFAPSRQEAAFCLLEVFLAQIVSGQVPPDVGVDRIVTQVYRQGDWDDRNVHCVGDSLGIELLYSLWDAIDDLREANHSFQPPRSNAELIREAMDDIRTEASRLLAARPWRQKHGAA